MGVDVDDVDEKLDEMVQSFRFGLDSGTLLLCGGGGGGGVVVVSLSAMIVLW